MVSNMHKHNALKGNQKGLVSLTVTVIVMIVVTLIVSSFALIVRREQRRSLDRQLSAQAFYAAESGIEDASSAMNTDKLTQLTENITDCSGPNSFKERALAISGVDYNSVISDNIEYTCVLIDQQPKSWEASSINPDDGSFVVPINSTSNINKLQIGWQEKDGGTNFPVNYPNLLQGGMEAPMLRITIMPGFNGGPLDRNTLNNQSHTLFLYPGFNGVAGIKDTVTYLNGGAGWGPTNNLQGKIVSGNCNSGNSPYHCNVEIDGLNAQEYFVHVQPLYKSAALSIVAEDASGPLPIVGSQALIDATGRAADVLRRIQVRVPVGDGLQTSALSGLIPPGALVSEDSICKQWELTLTDAVNLCDGSASVPLGNPSGGGAAGDATIGTCSPPSDPICQNSNGDPNAPVYRWATTFTNKSNNNPSDVQDCTWDWGDGTPATTYPGSHQACTFEGKVVHDYNPPTDSRGWEDLIENTLGAQGCWRFNVTLTMRFTAASGLSNDQDFYTKYLPGGQANDPPNPTTGTGICYGKPHPVWPG